jgi:hypothetical protein
MPGAIAEDARSRPSSTRMYCMVGPVKIRLSAREVPQGPLSHEPNAVPMTVPPWREIALSGPCCINNCCWNSPPDSFASGPAGIYSGSIILIQFLIRRT